MEDYSKKLEKFIETNFNLKKETVNSKVKPLNVAIREGVRPGMSIHLGYFQPRAEATLFEIVRQFWGSRPEFTLISAGLRTTNTIMIYGKLVKRIISAFNGDTYPTPGPNPVYQDAYRNKEVIYENWSLLTLTQRLFAGALGLPFMPTGSLLGSDMEKENAKDYMILEDPFDTGKQVGVVKALQADISLVHGLAADPSGNTILPPPYGEGIYGVMGSKEGAIVTVEKIVPHEVIRSYSHFVRIPAHVVKSVSEVKMGSHPVSLYSMNIEEFKGYADDYQFLKDMRQACRDKKSLDEWLEYWVFSCKDQDDYLKKLGTTRISKLKSTAEPLSWKVDITNILKKKEKKDKIADTSYTQNEMMVVVAARKIVEKVLTGSFSTILAGIGPSYLAAVVAHWKLYMLGKELKIMAEVGIFGAEPRPADPYLLNMRNFATVDLFSDIIDTLGVFVSGSENKCLGIMGAGQVDQFGNINSTIIKEEEFYLTGSGGANDIASGANQTMVLAHQSQSRFCEKVSYITSPGTNIKTLISTLGVFEKLEGNDRFTLTGVFPSNNHILERTANDDGEDNEFTNLVHMIQQQCGWELSVADKLIKWEPPTIEELLYIRTLDPDNYFLK